MAIQFLRGSKSKIDASTRVLKAGQPLYSTDEHKLKVGDGTTAVKSLPYVVSDADSTLSSTSTNPIQNKAVNTALNGKFDKTGGKLTGKVIEETASNPYYGLKISSQDQYWYTQVVDNKMGIGPNWDGSLKVRVDGQVSIPQRLSLASTDSYGPNIPSDMETGEVFFQTINTNFILDNIYPVGSVYMSMSSTNPETLFGGGTWAPVQGRFLIGANSTYTAGSTGSFTAATGTAKTVAPYMAVYMWYRTA